MSIAYARNLPKGVEVLTPAAYNEREDDKLPVIHTVRTHLRLSKVYGPKLANALELEYIRSMNRHCRDFSCGQAYRIIIGPQLVYVPRDLEAKVSAELVAFLNKLVSPLEKTAASGKSAGWMRQLLLRRKR